VQQRTREIGIRKAIGAARREIMYQFLVESLVISGGGAVIGILLGIAIPVTAQFFLPGSLRVPVSPLSVIVAFVVSCSTGLFFRVLAGESGPRAWSRWSRCDTSEIDFGNRKLEAGNSWTGGRLAMVKRIRIAAVGGQC